MPGSTGAITQVVGLSTQIIGIWVAALLTLAIYSFLYGDNPVYKVAEHIFVGISAAYGAALTYHLAIIPKLYNPLFRPDLVPEADGPQYVLIIPGVLGLLIFSRFVPRYDWLSRWPIAFIMGLYAGLSIPRVIQTNILKQVLATIAPVLPVDAGGEYLVFSGFENLLLVVGVVCTLAYFYFSLPHRGALGGMSRVGIWFLMIGFGAGFGNTVMARISLLIGRVQFLLYDWLPTIGIHLGSGPGLG